MDDSARDLLPQVSPAERLHVVAAGDILAEPGRTGWLVDAAEATG